MKPATIFDGIVIALLLTVLSFVAELVLPLFIGVRSAAMVVIALTALLYLGYLFHNSSIRAGKLTLASCCALLLAAPPIVFDTLSGTAFAAVAVIWLARALLFAPSLLLSAADLALCLLGAVLAGYAGLQGYGTTAAAWCFLLTQALWAAIPKRAGNQFAQPSNGAAPNRFNHAHDSAETALRQLAKGTEQ